MSNIRLNKDMIGNKVRCIYKADCYHPEVGTIGTIVDYDKSDTYTSYKVQWPKGTTVRDDKWWAINKCIELVEDNMTNEQKIPDMSNKEIWEMLKPKMEKNGLKSTVSVTHVPTLWDGKDLIKFKKAYYEDDVHNAIALSYKVGYLRSQKGRPFKIGSNKTGHSEPKKEKTGHWVPVDIEQVSRGDYKVVEDCSGWHYEYLGTYKQGEDGKFYQWVEDDE